MITKQDCLSLLVKIEDEKQIKTDKYIQQILTSRELPLDVLKFIWAQRGLAAIDFYEMLRKRSNEHKSVLYKNIISEIGPKTDIIVVLSSLLTQIALYGSKLDNKDLFYKEIRAEEISRALNLYYRESDLALCQTVLKMIRSDLLVLEYIAERRNLS